LRRARVNGNKSTIFFSAGLRWTSFRNRDAALELLTDDIETEDGYANEAADAEGCGVSPPADVNEKVVALWPERLGGENGLVLYFEDDALELTDSVLLREEAGLVRSARCLILSIPLASNGVRRTAFVGSRISGGS
jgi:hypothetical protein